jgi:hypothetical protein
MGYVDLMAVFNDLSREIPVLIFKHLMTIVGDVLINLATVSGMVLEVWIAGTI